MDAFDHLRTFDCTQEPEFQGGHFAFRTLKKLYICRDYSSLF